MIKENIFVFDVESISLHGTGFAVGAIVLNRGGTKVDQFELMSLEGAAVASDWVKENVIPHLQDMTTCRFDRTLRDEFYEFYMKHKDTAEIWSDCNFPVETNFLSEIVKDDWVNRQWNMPYPLKDISTLFDVEIDRIEACGIPGLRKHNPFDDARASAHLLLKKV